eukprot:895891_1
MAAVAIGTSIWLPAILFGHGLLLALTPVIAQLNGSGRRERIAHQVRQGFWLAGFVSVLIMLVLWNAGYIIRSMENIDPALADKAVGYLRALLWGAPGFLVGGKPEVLAQTEAKLRNQWNVNIVGSQDGYFKPEQRQALFERIHASGAQ